MLTFLRILAGLVLLLALLAAAAFLLPRQVNISRDIQIDAVPPEAVFPYINSLEQMQAWNPWLERDADVAVSFEGPTAGVGAKMIWQSEQRDVGQGAQEIVESVENERVVSALEFGGRGDAVATLSLQPEDGGTRVTWGLDADLGNAPMLRWMGLAMDRMVGGDYETGLANLKALLETPR